VGFLVKENRMEHHVTEKHPGADIVRRQRGKIFPQLET
jgi:hypothetical protein